MLRSICGANCAECPSGSMCPGCTETNGCPFGRECFVAKYIRLGGMDSYRAFQKGLMDEINALHIEGMGEVTELVPLVGRFVNLEYPIPGGAVKFLRDDEMYLGAQVPDLLDDSGKTCFGVIARESFLLVCQYGENGADPELVLYRRR